MLQLRFIIDQFVGEQQLIEMSNHSFIVLLFTAITFRVISSNVTESSHVVNSCSPDQFQCKSGQCVDESKVCNYYPDCSDASDENNCGWCDFSTGSLCGWNKTDNLEYSCKYRGYSGKCFLGQERCFNPEYYNFTLTSPVLRETSEDCQIKFSYFTYNSNNNNFPDVIVSRLFNTFKTHIKPLTLKSNTNGLGIVDIGYILPEPESRLLLQFLQPTNACGTCGIGNITFNNCIPKKIPISCDFEENINCTWWFIGNRFAGKWKWDSDGYIYTDQNDIAEIRSPLIEPNEKGACLSFQYLSNCTKNSLRLSKMNLMNDHDETVIWSTKDSTHALWKEVQLFINISVDIDIGFLGKSMNGIIAIDNIVYKNGPCPAPKPNFNELSCTFENIEERKNLCNLVKVQNSCLIQAEVVSKEDGYFGKGPKSDHTLSRKEGWFLNFNQNSSRCNESLHGVEETRLIYPRTFGSSSPRCLYFWYQVSSNQVTLSIKVGTNQFDELRLWHVSGKITKWKLAAIRLDAELAYDIVFSVQFNNFNLDSYVSIDDIMIEQGDKCNTNLFELYQQRNNLIDSEF